MFKEENIISYGGGVNSTALIILMKNNSIKIDNIIFSDTGAEMPQTYKYIPYFKKWLKKNNLKFTTVKHKHKKIYEYYFDRKLLPLRMFRSCTDHFKIRPIYKYIKEKYPTYYKINMFLGIDFGEKHRAKESKRDMQFMKYPLIDFKLDRKGCVDLIKQEGLEVPIKSGCYFCPFQSKTEWLKLLKNDPKLFTKSINLEENGKRFPEFTLFNIPLRKLRHIEKTQTRLTSFKEITEVEKCTYCHS